MKDPVRIEAQCNALLKAMLGSDEFVKKWWESPNKAFCDDTPSVIFSVAPESVYKYLMKCAEGEW